MFAVYITHPQVNIDPNVPVPQWGLSPLGAERARKAAALPWARNFGRIISSAEVKAIETAEIFARVSGCTVEIVDAMHENDRSATGFLAPPEFEAAADQFFAHPTDSFRGWETATHAQARIVAAVTATLLGHDPSNPIAFVGHGGVGTLLKCHLEGLPICRSADQPAGGGNVFCFSLADLTVACDWTAIEDWPGVEQ